MLEDRIETIRKAVAKVQNDDTSEPVTDDSEVELNFNHNKGENNE